MRTAFYCSIHFVHTDIALEIAIACLKLDNGRHVSIHIVPNSCRTVKHVRLLRILISSVYIYDRWN
jgi:hypothetical protein